MFNINSSHKVTIAFFTLFLFMPVSISFANEQTNIAPFGIIDLQSAIAKLPEASKKIIEDIRLLESDRKGIRVFRLYKPVPPHYHEKSDAVLYLIDGEVSVAINQDTPQRVTPGMVLHWQRGVIHAVPEIHTTTATFIVVDIPTRDPADAVFIDNQGVEFLN